MDLIELKEEATDTNLYILEGRIKEQDKEGKRTAEPKTRGQDVDVKRDKKKRGRAQWEDRE